ncbi:hypothetical protein HFO60_26825 [Rhizobium leguminosarum]|uniref:hypothetical protein n=1 Tax=Rhizobium leguminosarum TaxID=384 RepID=UPI001C970A44|nr:hypothetical protein [Rhizobium leguminosarum]MBY5524191.1 hypothetical protein [Rhizobium leguminosarum]MBY5543589.1 hypothetical protein [Rhizobium leguminosarum]
MEKAAWQLCVNQIQPCDAKLFLGIQSAIRRQSSQEHQVESNNLKRRGIELCIKPRPTLSVIILCVAEATVASETNVMLNLAGFDVVPLGACKPADEFDAFRLDPCVAEASFVIGKQDPTMSF